MTSLNNTVETINAAASAIVSAESRVQPPTVPKKRWGGCWSLYWCFGYHKTSKRIGHAVVISEPEVPGAVIPVTENQARSTSTVLPFIVPPSSPASFLQSDPPSATQSPAGLVSLTSHSVNSFSPGGPASIFAIGPYAHETQLVTPPAFSAFTTEPSTASFTPPPESVQLTTPSSPEVPFAQLLTSSLERARRNSGTNQKLALSHSEFQSYQLYPGSPGGQLISPGSAVSNSGTSSPFPDRNPILDIRMGEAPKFLRFEHFAARKWGSRLGSGSVTPDGIGLGSRLGSGSVTPDGVGLASRLGSGSVTPDAVALHSRLGSACLTPDCGGLLENPISEVASLANSNNGMKIGDLVVNQRVSFELSGEEVAQCLEIKSGASNRTFLEYPQHVAAENLTESDRMQLKSGIGGTWSEMSEKPSEETEEEHCYRKHRSITLGSIKEFNFDNSKGEVPEKRTISSEWWANEATGGKEAKPESYWTFFPMLQPEVS
uniref:Hydroxyproline-rich glycoprotein family protein n=1 Tax=Rhizophora mucronata TaxID=61149 RepID=A0A2P2K8V7_RHIMU